MIFKNTIKCLGLLAMLAFAGMTAGAQQESSASSLLKGIKPLDSGTELGLLPSANGKPGEVQHSKSKANTDPRTNADATEITATTEASFDQQTRKAVFIGNVRVKHPQFTLTAERLTAILKKDLADNHLKNGDQTPAVKAPEASKGGGGLEKVIAEGGVVIVQEKPAENGGEPTRYVAKAARAEYDDATGNVTLSGWPQVAQGINMQVATEESTVMVLNRNGKMSTLGGNKTVIMDTGKPTPHP